MKDYDRKHKKSFLGQNLMVRMKPIKLHSNEIDYNDIFFHILKNENSVESYVIKKNVNGV